MDFLTFKSFISTEVLILFYYIGAIILPISLWYIIKWFTQKYNLIDTIYMKGKIVLWQSLNIKQRLFIIALFLSGIFFMELFWRMLFEFLIAYMQIRDALLLQT